MFDIAISGKPADGRSETVRVMGWDYPVDKARQWNFLAVSCDLDAKKATCYHNENPAEIALKAPIADSMTFRSFSFTIGNWVDVDKLNIPRSFSCKGCMGELMVFRAALSPDEINRLRQGSNPIADDELINQPDLTR